MTEPFKDTFKVRWSDLDSNSHMRHTAYLDLCAAARLSFLSKGGFGDREFKDANLGPILFSETINYFKEVRGTDSIEIRVNISGLSEDGRKWEFNQDMFRLSDNEKIANLKATGAWLDLDARKIVKPPEKLFSIFRTAPKSEEFKVL